MKLHECAFFADENIHPDLIRYFQKKGYDITDVAQLNLTGKPDSNIIYEAYKTHRIIITHDSDFGTLAIANREPFWGILFIRSGHIRGEISISTIRTLFEKDLDFTPGIIIVAQRQNDSLKIRIRPGDND